MSENRMLRSKRLVCALSLALALPSPSRAANDNFTVNGSAIGSLAPGGYLPGFAAYFPNGLFSASSPAYVQGSVSATLPGFTPGGSFATVTAPSGSSSAATALPAGTVVVFFNNGTVPASINLGGSGVAATASNNIVPANGALALTVASNTYFAAWGIGGSASIVASGGSGLATGWAGGGGLVAQGTGSTSNPWYMLPGTGGVFPISATALPLPSGASTSALQPAINADGGSQAHVMNFPTSQTVYDPTVAGAVAGLGETPPHQITAQGMLYTDVSTTITTSGNSGILPLDSGNLLAATITAGTVTGTTPSVIFSVLECVDGVNCVQKAACPTAITSTGNTCILQPREFIGQRQWMWTVTGSSVSVPITIKTLRSTGNGITARTGYDPVFHNYSLSGSVAVVGTTFDIEGCKVFSAIVTTTAYTSGSYQAQTYLSMDGSHWIAYGTQSTVSAAGTNLYQTSANWNLEGFKYGRWSIQSGSSPTGIAIGDVYEICDR